MCECVHMCGAGMHVHGLGLYGQGSSRLDVEPQYIMSRAGFIPPRCTHVCCAVWCVPACILPYPFVRPPATRHLLAPRGLRPSRHLRIAIFCAT